MTASAALAHVLAAYPELAADQVRAVAYEAALQGLAPEVVAGVVASLRSVGRGLPPPAMLRLAVLARQARLQPSGPPDPPPPSRAFRSRGSRSPMRPSLSSRRAPGLAMAVTGLCAFLALAATAEPWLIGSGAGQVLELEGATIGAGNLVAKAEFVALIAAIIGVIYVCRRSSNRHLAQAFGFIGLLHVASVAFGVRAFQQMGSLQDDLESSLPVGTIAYRNARLGPVPELVVQPAFWSALLVAVTGAAAAVYGLVVAIRRGEPLARGAALRRAARRWAVIGASLVVLAGLSAVAIATRGPGDTDRVSSRALETTQAKLDAAAIAKARAAYLKIDGRISGRVARAETALSSALRDGEPVRVGSALATYVRVQTDQRRALTSPDIGQRIVIDQVGMLMAAITHQINAYEAARAHVEQNGTLGPGDQDALSGADARAAAADAALRSALGLPPR